MENKIQRQIISPMSVLHLKSNPCGSNVIVWSVQTANGECKSVSDSESNKVAAMQTANNKTIENQIDSCDADETSEDLQYGPGIVSKLRCRYLSLALRHAVKKQRPSLDNLRRATSLNNLLDADDAVDMGIVRETNEMDEEEAAAAATATEAMCAEISADDASSHRSWHANKNNGNTGSGQTNPKTRIANGTSDQGDDTHTKHQTERQYHRHTNGDNNRYARQTSRGNDSTKRARSVETLMGHDNHSWHRDSDDDYPSSNPISLHELHGNDAQSPHGNGHSTALNDSKMRNTRESNESNRPKRPVSWMAATERPPPDFVRQTMLIFEAASNRTARLPAWHTNGAVAAKIASYKHLIGHEKKTPVPAVHSSGGRIPNVKPRTVDRSGVYNEPNQDVSTIRNNLERANRTNQVPLPNGGPIPAVRSLPQASVTQIDSLGVYRDPKPFDSPDQSPSLSLISTPSVIASSRPSSTPHLDNMDHLTIEKPVSQQLNDLDYSTIISHMAHLALDSPQPPVDSQMHADCEGSVHGPGASTVGYSNGQRAGNTFNVDSMLGRIRKNSAVTVQQLEPLANGNAAKSYLPSHTTAGVFNQNGVLNKPEHQHIDQSPETNIRQVGIIRPLVAEPKVPSIVYSSPPPPPDNSFRNNINIDSDSDSIENRAVKRDVTLEDAFKMQPAEKSLLQAAETTQPMMSSIITNSADGSGGIINLAAISQQPSTFDSAASVSIACSKRSAIAMDLTSNGNSSSNSIIFNFQDREDVPDYIDSSLIIRPKREVSKPGESGYVVLDNLTVETSTYPEPDELWTLHNNPPSPCNVSFENAYVIINGRSNIKAGPKEQKRLSIQFNELLTKTFEYPSEISLREDGNPSPIGDERMPDGTHSPIGGADGSSGANFMASTPISSVPLGNYVPLKAATFTNNFELGVTRTYSPNTSATSNISICDASNTANLNVTNGPTSPNGSDNMQYIKPATDEQIVAWSEGVSDLLF